MEARSQNLLLAAANGDHHALEALLRRHLPGLRAFLRLRIGPVIRSHESSGDIAQSVCREILTRADRFAHGGEAGARRPCLRLSYGHSHSDRRRRRQVPRAGAWGLVPTS